MFVKSLPADRGMLFVYAEERPIAMWMKNTLRLVGHAVH